MLVKRSSWHTTQHWEQWRENNKLSWRMSDYNPLLSIGFNTWSVTGVWISSLCIISLHTTEDTALICRRYITVKFCSLHDRMQGQPGPLEVNNLTCEWEGPSSGSLVVLVLETLTFWTETQRLSTEPPLVLRSCGSRNNFQSDLESIKASKDPPLSGLDNNTKTVCYCPGLPEWGSALNDKCAFISVFTETSRK